MMIRKKIFSFGFVLSYCFVGIIAPAVVIGGASGKSQVTSARIANPASEYCVRNGGMLVIKKHKDAGEYGLCTFDNNKQCEEWAMFRGDCPVGGIKTDDHVNAVSTYCSLRGGIYEAAGSKSVEPEKGNCKFRNGKICDALDYYNGKCNSIVETSKSTYSDPFEFCSAVITENLPDSRYDGDVIPDRIVKGMIRQGIVSGSTPEEFQKNVVWRCMNGAIWVCHFGANIPCMDKAEISQLPTTGMIEYCRVNPDSEAIPAYATGRATIYEWKCIDVKPKAGRQIFKVDQQGYLADFWFELKPE